MPERVKDGHVWVGAATLAIPIGVVRQAFRRRIFIVRKNDKVSIEEVYCNNCRVTYERAVGKPCQAAESREHLIGGPIGDKRVKRVDDGEQLRAATG